MSRQLKLGIVGYGFVGKATEHGFSINTKTFIADPKVNTNIDDLSEFMPEIIFVCVPTPMSNDGDQDSSIIELVVRELKEKCPNSAKVIKSTVLPNVLDEMQKIDKNIIYNPEFLREKYANDDFVKANMIIFGGNKGIAHKVSDAYLKHSVCETKEHIFTDIKTASLIKYSINTFLANKVIFFNELYAIFETFDTQENWENVVNAISKDPRIGKSHMEVPGHDGRYGFGGACFPKDTLAFAKYAQKLGLDPSVLKNTIIKNNKIRSVYSDLDAREKEQNVSFDDKI